MRSPVVLAGALALVACGSEAPSPLERQEMERAGLNAPLAEDRIELRGRGLAAGSEAFYFAAGRSEVEARLERVLGEEEQRGENAECGAGPVQFTSYPGGLTLNFQEDRLAGWSWDAPSAAIGVEGGLAVGMERQDIAGQPGFALIEGSTLGEEFSYGERIGGFLDGDRVSGLYAGLNCFMR